MEPERAAPEPMRIEAVVSLKGTKEAGAPESPGLQRFKTTVDLVKAIVWPVLVLLLFLALRQPILDSARVVPELLGRSTKITVGQLIVEIQEAARATGNLELAGLVKGLSPAAINVLLNTGRASQQVVGTNPGDGRSFYFPKDLAVKALGELERKELLKFEEPWDSFTGFVSTLPLKKQEGGGEMQMLVATSELREPDRRRLLGQRYELTTLGQRAFELVVRLVVQLVGGAQ